MLSVGEHLWQDALQAQSERIDAVSLAGLPHQCTQEVVGQEVRPHFFDDHLGRFRRQHVHAQRGLEMIEIHLNLPETKKLEKLEKLETSRN